MIITSSARKSSFTTLFLRAEPFGVLRERVCDEFSVLAILMYKKLVCFVLVLLPNSAATSQDYKEKSGYRVSLKTLSSYFKSEMF